MVVLFMAVMMFSAFGFVIVENVGADSYLGQKVNIVYVRFTGEPSSQYVNFYQMKTVFRPHLLWSGGGDRWWENYGFPWDAFVKGYEIEQYSSNVWSFVDWWENNPEEREGNYYVLDAGMTMYGQVYCGFAQGLLRYEHFSAILFLAKWTGWGWYKMTFNNIRYTVRRSLGTGLGFWDGNEPDCFNIFQPCIFKSTFDPDWGYMCYLCEAYGLPTVINQYWS
jgi:hypothetical protein